MRMSHILFICIFTTTFSSIQSLFSQEIKISGKITSNGKSLPFATILIQGENKGSLSDSLGNYKISIENNKEISLEIRYLGYSRFVKTIKTTNKSIILDFDLANNQLTLDEVVVSGTLKEVSRLDSPVPVEVYSPQFFKKNPTPSIFDAMQNINGVRPQLNCNICNTGDIHINGLEGPYTMILIDGMPLVSSLSSVYGLSGIPNSLVERIEIVKGPASSLYGSEAVGGLINIITKKAGAANKLSIDLQSNTWQETNADLGFKLKAGKKATILNGINYFKFGNIVDNNKDGFTDVTLQDRISLFQKWDFERKDNRIFTIAGRYLYEDRWGGETTWNKSFRGGDSIYGESIYTNRWELLGNYQLPFKEKFLMSFSLNNHQQDSRYGNTSFNANQTIAFSQITWDKKLGKNDFLVGSGIRYTFYDDNTPATEINDTLGIKNNPNSNYLPGIFVQDEITFSKKHKVLLGIRYDYNDKHGNILTPRFAYKFSISEKSILRLNLGTGFRVVNIFTEDHAALTGARSVVIENNLNPERSYNANLNYIKKFFSIKGLYLGIDASLFYTYFDNKIFANYEEDPNKIIYSNLNGHAISQGFNVNLDFVLWKGIKVLAGMTYMDVASVENGVKRNQILTEKVTGTWSASYKIEKIHLNIDYTGNLYSPMRLPLLGDLDPRNEFSPWWSIQNINLVYSGLKNIEFYGGVKNLLNWTPNKGNLFIIARSNDPFDKNVHFDSEGNPLATASNPYGLTFDPSYVYGPNQGIRAYFGIRINIK